VCSLREQKPSRWQTLISIQDVYTKRYEILHRIYCVSQSRRWNEERKLTKNLDTHKQKGSTRNMMKGQEEMKKLMKRKRQREMREMRWQSPFGLAWFGLVWFPLLAQEVRQGN
jgi:hypothetical protein